MRNPNKTFLGTTRNSPPEKVDVRQTNEERKDTSVDSFDPRGEAGFALQNSSVGNGARCFGNHVVLWLWHAVLPNRLHELHPALCAVFVLPVVACTTRARFLRYICPSFRSTLRLGYGVFRCVEMAGTS